MKIKVFSVVLLLFVAGYTVAQDIELDSNVQVEHSKFEVEVHYSAWTVTPISALFKDRLDAYYTKEVLAAFENAIAGTGIAFDPSELGFNGDFDYSSRGSAYGLTFRYLSKNSRFSFGLSVDKTNVSVSGSTKIINSALLSSTGIGEVNFKPILIGLQTQYFFNKNRRFTPYMSLGLGAGLINKNDITQNKVSIITENEVFLIGPVRTLQEYTLQESEDRGSQPVPGVLPLVQLGFGVKAKIADPISSILELGVYNGIHARVGLVVGI